MEGKLHEEIYQYLTAQFEPGEEVPADVFVKYFLSGGYVPAKYGYTNMREMFADLKDLLNSKTGDDGKAVVQIEKRISSEGREEEVHSRKSDIGLFEGMTPEESAVRQEKPGTASSRASGLGRETEVHEPTSLDDEIRKKIYTAVALGLQLEKPLYMSTLSPVLRYAGVRHDQLGFLKSKNMLRCCSDFMTFEEVIMNGVPQTLVTVHHVPEWDELLRGISRPVGGEELNQEEKERIYGVLCEHMQFGEPVHMAAFSPILKTYGFDYRRYGFQKVKELAAQLQEFLSLQEVMMNGVPQTLVTLHEISDSDGRREEGEKPEQELHQLAFLPPKILGLLSRMTGSPVWACEEALEKSYIQARENGTLTVERKHIVRRGVASADKELTMRFPLTLKTMRSDMLMGELHEAGSTEGKKWFLAWVGSPEEGKEETGPEETEGEAGREAVLTEVLTDCCALSDSVVRAAAYKAFSCTEPEAFRMITEDYAAAFGTEALKKQGEEYYYPAVSCEGEKTVYVLIAPNRIGDKPFYVRFVGSSLVFADSAEENSQPELPENPASPDDEEMQEVRMDNAPLPEELEELAFLPAPTVNLLAHFCGLLEEPMLEQLRESFRDCREKGRISRRPDEIRFPLLCRNLKGQEVTVYLRPGTGGKQPWFLQYFDGKDLPQEAEEPKEPDALEEFAFLGDWNGQLRQLQQLAAAESWDFDRSGSLDNLNYYINGSFIRILSQDKLIFDSEKTMAVFNTGLITRYGHDIYAQFAKNLPGSKLNWRFERFVTGRLSPDLTETPLYPTYLDGKLTPWFEADRNIMPLSHEVIMNRIRFLPCEFLRRCSETFEISLIEQMSTDASLAAGCYERLEACYRRNSGQVERMADAIVRAVNYGMHRVRRDYCYTAAGYLPELDEPVWLMPLTLQGNTPDVAAAFVLEYGSYRICDLLPLKEAYLAARFVRKLDSCWLTAAFLKDERNLNE